jgi:hypothetical protein
MSGNDRHRGRPVVRYPHTEPTFVMRRFSLMLLPFLSAFALMFGLYYLFGAYQLVRLGRFVYAALYFVFGCVGVGLAVAIWVSRKRVGRGGGAPPAP